ncbi:MAG: UDP-N-acetylmuramate dehydrogenase [Bryobacteraceae bacterium]
MRLPGLSGLTVRKDVPLSGYTRFGIGGPADVLIDAASEEEFQAVIADIRASRQPCLVIGGGTNLIVSDEGFRGAVIRYTADRISARENLVTADAGAMLQDLVDFSIDHALAGIHTMTGIPGWVGGAVYGNAGAYGRSIHQSVVSVRFFDGETVRDFQNADCQFHYRDSIFKHRKEWIIFSTTLELTPGNGAELRAKAEGIWNVRNEKYPPTMKCAGSIFKNLLFAELPESVQRQVPPELVREGKVPSAYFLELVDAKGVKNGDIHVADYHANLIYNAGNGTSRQVCEVIDDLKARVRARFQFNVEEEVQYVGFTGR